MTNDEIRDELNDMLSTASLFSKACGGDPVIDRRAGVLTAIRDRLALADRLADECERLIVMPDNEIRDELTV